MDSSNQPHLPAQVTLQQLIASLNHLAAQDSSAELELIELKEGDILFEQGDEGDTVYVLIAGMLSVHVRHDDGTESEINRHAPGAIVGEMALLSGQTRSATIYAVNDVGLLRLSGATYSALVAQEPGTERLVRSEVETRWQDIQLSQVLRDLVGDVDPLTLQNWREEIEWVRLSNGDVIFRQGEAPDGMYIVLNGRLRVMVESKDGAEKTLAEISPGETVGEFALLTGEPRSATVYAARDSSVVKITTATFNKLAQSNAHFMTAITKIIVTRQQRLLDQGKPLAPSALSIALIPAGNSADISAFAQQLSQAMATYGSVAALDTHWFESSFGNDGTAQTLPDDTLTSMLAAQLDELEANKAFVIYAADATPTMWTQRCLGRADRVLIIANPADDPIPGAVERLAAEFEIPVRTELVMWHSAETEHPTGTAKWLDVRAVHAHHHIRQGDDRHMARLARRLTGHAIALVFSGGGALGFAEMGVYKALLELNIPFDYVGGTSMGAIITGGIARGFSYAEFEKQAQLMADTGVMDITLPLAALTASKNVSIMLQEMFGGFEIEDLWLPYFCVSCNYSLAETVVHRRGTLWRAIRASMAVPGVFLPVVEDGNVLVDGGIMDNFPVETMVSLCETDGVIGVVINPFKERKREYDYDMSLSGWEILWSRINPFRKPLRTPSMLRTLTRASEINGIRTSKQQEGLVDLLLAPDVKGYSFTDYEKWSALSQIGYDNAVEPLRAWKAGRADLG